MSRSNYNTNSSNILLKLEPSGSSQLPYISGIVMGIILILATVLFDVKVNSLYYYSILMVMVFYLLIDHGFRKRHNIRLIELDERMLHIYKGKKMQHEKIEINKIAEVSSRKLLLNRTVTLILKPDEKNKKSTYRISSDQISNDALLQLSEKLRKLI